MKYLNTFNEINENSTDVSLYKEILIKNGYTNNSDRWFKKETKDNIHYAWIWKSKNSMKMVGYKKEEGKEYGEKLYFVSPNDEMNDKILQDFISQNVK